MSEGLYKQECPLVQAAQSGNKLIFVESKSKRADEVWSHVLYGCWVKTSKTEVKVANLVESKKLLHTLLSYTSLTLLPLMLLLSATN